MHREQNFLSRSWKAYLSLIEESPGLAGGITCQEQTNGSQAARWRLFQGRRGDGRFLLFYTNNVPLMGQDLWVLPLEGDRKPALLLGTQFNEREGIFSPDMRWIAYTSNESGRAEVYVRPFTASGPSGSTGAPSLGEGKWQVSKDGGGLAKWRADGKELIFRAPNGSPMTVDVTATGAAFQAGVPKQLFALPPNVGDWEVTADGKRFLAAVPPVQHASQTPITVVLNWEAAWQK